VLTRDFLYCLVKVKYQTATTAFWDRLISLPIRSTHDSLIIDWLEGNVYYN